MADNKSKGILTDITLDLESPTLLFREGGHSIYWLGITDETAFRCNTYLITDGDDGIIVDPGNRGFFEQVKLRVAQIMEPEKVTGMIVCHQDPDVAASMPDWLEINPDMTVFSTPRSNVLLQHYGRKDYNFYDVEDEPLFALSSGRELKFIQAPFLHFPGAFTTYDIASQFLFSGDIWAALDTDWRLVVEDFDSHIEKMNLFHLDYMASNVAARGYVERLKGVEVSAILPQHGSIIGPAHVQSALEYLKNLDCGLDIIYPNA